MALLVVFMLSSTDCLAICAQIEVASDPTKSKVNFNQIDLERSSEIAIPCAQSSEILEVDFDNPYTVLRYVFEQSPASPVVYPTEGYYYFRFPHYGRMLSGNIRFSDPETSAISVGYFDFYNSDDTRHAMFYDGQEGIEVSYSSDGKYVDLSVNEVRKRFVLDSSAFDKPQYPLYAGETFVSGIRDESGYYLHLLYWTSDRSFYYILNTTRNLPEEWSLAYADGKREVWFGDDSRFCFVKHVRSGRIILVGVHEANIFLNNVYDGPFDQVPPRLSIRSMLEEAYPYVQDAGGIDEHGQFLKQDGRRVAISPYIAYKSGPGLISQLLDRITDDDSPSAWTRATYEYKKDWRPSLVGERQFQKHLAHLSSIWPANHYGSKSRLWGGDHSSPTSRSWSPNHDYHMSSSQD